MTVKDFIKANKLTVADMKSTTKTYEGSTDEIKFLRIFPLVDNQDTVVLSHNAALKATTKEDFLSLEVTHDDEFGWGIICPSNTTLLCSLL